MTRYTDGKKTVKVSMEHWKCARPSADFSADFFADANVRYSAEKDAWLVDDVDYLVEQCIDYLDGKGDFVDAKAEQDVLISFVYIDGEPDAATLAYDADAMHTDRLYLL